MRRFVAYTFLSTCSLCIILFFLTCIEIFFSLDTPIVEIAQESSRIVFWDIDPERTPLVLVGWALISLFFIPTILWVIKNIRGKDILQEMDTEEDWLGI